MKTGHWLCVIAALLAAPVLAPPVLAPPVIATPEPAVRQPMVQLTFRDGSAVALAPDDPRARAFRMLAGELVRSR